MSPTSCQTAPPRARRDRNYSGPVKTVSTIYDEYSDASDLTVAFSGSSIGRSAARADDTRPLLRFGADPARKLLRRARHDVESELAKRLARLRIAHRIHRFDDKALDYGRRRRRRR